MRSTEVNQHLLRLCAELGRPMTDADDLRARFNEAKPEGHAQLWLDIVAARLRAGADAETAAADAAQALEAHRTVVEEENEQDRQASRRFAEQLRTVMDKRRFFRPGRRRT